MKKTLVLLSAAFFASLMIGCASEPSQAQESNSASTFVEESIPDGKAILYLYNPNPVHFGITVSATAWSSVLIFSKTGPLATLPAYSYFPYITDPGTVELWWMVGGWTLTKESLVAKLAVDVAAGHAYFVTYDGDGVRVIPTEEAKKEDGIYSCKRVE
jgi:hypothetical protein